ncbi:hypothetical protein DFH06DRAFT_1489523 [Mycena polygramma]|nr:hypothetical protein DFH06DRAFT_1489523 [Mycena polygramma]
MSEVVPAFSASLVHRRPAGVMFASSVVLLFTTLFPLTSATPTASPGRATICSPPAAKNISFGTPNLANQDGSASIGPMELGVDNLNDTFLVVMWVPEVPVGPWNLVKAGPAFLIEHAHLPGKHLTAVQAGGFLNMDVGPLSQQLWNITCTTCPANGFADDCTFENFPFPGSPMQTQVCVENQTVAELGNETQITDCQGPQALGTLMKINYHLY